TWGGGSVAAARRAGRHGIGFLAQRDDPALAAAYREAAAEAGHEPGFCLLPPEGMPASVLVHDDVDAGWDEVGPALLADAVAYHSWNAEAGQADGMATLTSGSSVEELRRAEGSHRVVSVDGAVDLIERYGELGLQPLSGGLDPAIAWPYLRRVVDEVVPVAVSRRSARRDGAGRRGRTSP
ncbi:MAG TPA: hypothetical protein VHK88_04340, partial [Aquihabitans sp.]|nr:hypothetical protein [Aquihabitans sp.]